MKNDFNFAILESKSQKGLFRCENIRLPSSFNGGFFIGHIQLMKTLSAIKDNP